MNERPVVNLSQGDRLEFTAANAKAARADVMRGFANIQAYIADHAEEPFRAVLFMVIPEQPGPDGLNVDGFISGNVPLLSHYVGVLLESVNDQMQEANSEVPS